ncbi:MAG: DUF2298 domain-containing protein [Chloroflexota bacterium]|nr:DUF2298 domain-containing protein [Chloroflexota bacterium]
MVDVIRFWLAIQFIAVAALPFAWRILGVLPSRGYFLAKPIGLLAVTWVLWMGASLGFLRNNLGGIFFSWAVVAALSLVVGRSGFARAANGSRPFFVWLRGHLSLLLVGEILFLAGMMIWAWVRSYSPDIATAGGEKFMEITFLNGILRSQQFPPQDPWLSGYGISYYYFGYVMLALLTRLSGLAPGVAFNVGLGTWFGLTLVTAFSVAYDMVAVLFRSPFDETGSGSSSVSPAAVGGGLLGALFVAVLSNLEGFLESMQGMSIGSLAFWRWLDVKDLNCMRGPNFVEALSNCPTATGIAPERFFWWWRASRVINDRDLLGNSVEVIDEFPFFSFLLGDMHPHVLGLPFVLLAIGLALAIVMLGAPRIPSGGKESNGIPPSFFHRIMGLFPGGSIGFLLYALTLGGLAFLNTWDFPIYLFLTMLAVAAVLAWQSGGATGRAVVDTLLVGLGLAITGVLLYLPFYFGFQSQAGGILPNFIFPTRLSQFLVMFAPLLFAAILLLLALSGNGRKTFRDFLHFLPWTFLAPILFLLTMLAVGLWTDAGQDFVQRLMQLPVVREQVGEASLLQLLQGVVAIRIGSPWTYLVLAVLLAWVLGLLWSRLRITVGYETDIDITESAEQATVEPGHSILMTGSSDTLAVTTFALLALVTAFLLVFGVEFVYLRDLFSTRMNTVFKFYFQAWILMAVVAAFAVIYVARYGRPLLRYGGLGLLALLVVAGLFYPVFGTYTRAGKFAGEPTLDGLKYIERNNPGDVAAAQWLRDNVPGQANILEATGGSYTYSGRMAAMTGLPTLLGWDFHEFQWRGTRDEQNLRRPDIDRIYRDAANAELEALIDQWNIDFVIVGELERSTYQVTPQSEARLAALLDLVYDLDGVRIYRRRGS